MHAGVEHLHQLAPLHVHVDEVRVDPRRREDRRRLEQQVVLLRLHPFRLAEVEHLLHAQAERLEQSEAVDAADGELRRMNADAAVLRRRDVAVHREGDVHPLVHDPRLHELLPFGHDVQVAQRRPRVAEDVAVHQLVEPGRVHADLGAVDLHHELRLVVEVDRLPRLLRDELPAQRVDVQHGRGVDVEVDVAHHRLGRRMRQRLRRRRDVDAADLRNARGRRLGQLDRGHALAEAAAGGEQEQREEDGDRRRDQGHRLPRHRALHAG